MMQNSFGAQIMTTSLPTITGFREEAYGLFLDWDGCPAAVVVNPDDGDLAIRSSGTSADNPEIPRELCVGFVEPRDFGGFELVPTADSISELRLQIKSPLGNSWMNLGQTTDAATANSWIAKATAMISDAGSNADSLSASTPPTEETVSHAVVDAPTEQSDESAAPKRKPQLNPTASPDQFKAIPTYGSSGAAPTSHLEETPGNPPSLVPPEVLAVYQDGPREPVVVPAKNAPLEGALEAELDAAMSGAMAGASAVGSVAAPSTVAGATVPATEDQVEVGAKLKAKVQSVGAEHVFCEVGFRVPALLPTKQFPQGKQPHVGEEFLVVVDKFDAENGAILVSLPKATRRPKGNWEDLAVGHVVECVVNKTNKGGLEVTVSNMRAFLPASQVDLGFIAALETYVGQRFAVQVTEVNPAKRNLVVSRRALLIQERKEAAANFWTGVEVGQQFAGKVKTIKDYGAFIDLGGCDGFLHVGEMSWTRIKHPSEVLQEGQPVDVVILSLDREKQKIGLGMKQLAQNPWNAAAEKYAAGRTVSGRVTRTTDFGAFVELEQGVEGLIHISELDHRRVKRVTEVLSVGQEIQAQVLEVEPDRQRISLSLKALKEKPEAPKDEDLAPGKGQAYVSKRKEPLKGGTGNSGGGLFGNPGDFQ